MCWVSWLNVIFWFRDGSYGYCSGRLKAKMIERLGKVSILILVDEATWSRAW